MGRNFAAHAAELGNEVPSSPLIFFKPNTAVIGPDDAIVHLAASEQVSFEGELAVVIGRICKEVPLDRVAEVIFGYTIANDVTARDLQTPDGQWARAKGADTFCPLGPWMITHLSLAEAGDLEITTTLDGEVKQQGSTALMVRDIASLVSHITSFTTLLPGDVILTGHPGRGRLDEARSDRDREHRRDRVADQPRRRGVSAPLRPDRPGRPGAGAAVPAGAARSGFRVWRSLVGVLFGLSLYVLLGQLVTQLVVGIGWSIRSEGLDWSTFYRTSMAFERPVGMLAGHLGIASSSRSPWRWSRTGTGSGRAGCSRSSRGSGGATC